MAGTGIGEFLATIVAVGLQSPAATFEWWNLVLASTAPRWQAIAIDILAEEHWAQ